MAFAIVLSCRCVTAQQQNPVRVSLEDPELYYAFFRAHTATDLQIRASAAPVAAQLSSSAAAAYHITSDDLPNLTAQVRKFNVKNGALFLQQQYYLSAQRAAKKAPDVKILMGYQWQRQRLVMEAHAGIRGVLKPSNWTALHGYINGDFATALQATGGASTTTAGGGK
jgi:hypothetical protein